MKNILEEIEANYPVEKVLVNGHQVWSYLRIRYFRAYRTKEASKWGEGKPKPEAPSSLQRRKQSLMQRLMYKLKYMLVLVLRLVRLLGLARTLMKKLKRMLRRVQRLKRLQIFYGFKNWFGNYEYIALSHSGERRNVDGKFFNKLIDPVIDQLGRDKVLYIESVSALPCPIEKVHTKNIVSLGLLILLANIVARFMPGKCEIQGKAILENIQQDYGLHVDDSRWIKHFNAQRKVFSLMFRRIKPKVVLVTDYTSYAPAIKAAKERGVKVMEFQHGTIGKEHPSYNVGVEIDRGCFPDYLLVFGPRELETFANSRFIEAENVLPIGSFYIEHVRNNYVLESSLVKKLENYDRTVGVTLQPVIEKRTIEFIVQAANLDQRIFYILIPRASEEAEYRTLGLPGNVAAVTNKNFYELMMYVDFHATVYSTCALEAPSLGAQNILINIDNLAKKYFEALLYDNRITCYADTPEEFVQIISTFQRLDRATVSKLNQDIIATDYEQNIEKLISEHLLDEREG